jgi:predicted DCC family thiol-disulfide oxidoreductase YuxK
MDHARPSPSNPILLYDGICGLCNRLVQFVLQGDREDRFRFAALQSEFAREILARHGANPGALDTFYLVLDRGLPSERLAARSDAAAVMLQELGGFWSGLGAALRIFPRWLRDWGYNQVARRRYRLFGKYDACPLPAEKDRSKFLA